MATHEYQYAINSLLVNDEAGEISSFALQLDSILLEGEPLNDTGEKVLHETLKLLSGLTNSNNNYEDDYEGGYKDGFRDAEYGYHSKY